MLSDRLQLAMEKSGLSQADLARACGVKPPSVHGWLNGKSKFLRGENLLSAARALGVSEQWLATGRGPMKETGSAANDDEFVMVHRVDVSFSNGHGHIVYYEDEKPPLSFRADFLRKLGIPTGKAVVVDAVGNSNEGKIQDGAVVLLNSADRANLNGDFFAFRVNGELLIKRLSEIKGVGILATAENSNFHPKNTVYTNPDEFEVIGRAVWTGVEL